MYRNKVTDFICAENDPVVATTYGKIRGYRENELYSFRGITYAKAERFMPPSKPDNWEGIIDTQDYGFVCPQLPDKEVQGNLAFPKRYWLEREDCQTLNIWTKTLDPEKKQPVMIWLHGGGFSKGSVMELECYEGENLARYGEVVSVSISHRLNIFGFLDLSEYGAEYELSGNVGMEDIVAALEWIRDNIALFGGDPENVTVFGESGGGGKVAALLQMADADGLYHRAVIESGILPGVQKTPEEAKKDAKALAEKYVEAAGGLTHLRTMPWQELLKLMEQVSESAFMSWGPTPMTGTYTGDFRTAGFRKETLNIPVICGSVFMELNPRSASLKPRVSLTAGERREAVAKAYGEDHADEVITAFKKAYPEFNVYYASEADCMVRVPTKEFCVKRTEAGGKVWNYLFAHESDYKGGILSTHADELAFIFHNVDYLGCQMNHDPEHSALWMQDLIFKAWVSFAKNGDPNYEGLPLWKPLSENDAECFIFSKSPRCVPDHDKEFMECLLKYSRYSKPMFYRERAKGTEQEERIRRYEESYDMLDRLTAQLDDILRLFKESEGRLKELDEYYTGPLWRQDFEDDEAGLLPKGLKRGILSEDSIYNLLERVNELKNSMKEM